MNWTQPHALRNHYWEAEHDFWITSRQFRNLITDQTRERWVLFNGLNELGVYDTLQEAQNAAEPAHGVNEDKESDPVCYWCQGSHPGQICEFAPYYVEGAK